MYSTAGVATPTATPTLDDSVHYIISTCWYDSWIQLHVLHQSKAKRRIYPFLARLEGIGERRRSKRLGAVLNEDELLLLCSNSELVSVSSAIANWQIHVNSKSCDLNTDSAILRVYKSRACPSLKFNDNYSRIILLFYEHLLFPKKFRNNVRSLIMELLPEPLQKEISFTASRYSAA